MNSGRHLIGLSLASLALLIGCQKTDVRQPINVSNSEKTGDSKANEKVINKAGCLDLALAGEVLKAKDNEVGRFHTFELTLANPGGTIGNLDLVKDRKIVAQAIEADSSLHGDFEFPRVKDVRTGLDIFNAVNQVNCESVTVKDSNGQLHEYAIEAEQSKMAKTNRLVLRDKKQSNTWKVVQFSGGSRLVIFEVKPLSPITICGTKKNFLLVRGSEFSIGNSVRNSAQLNLELAKLLVEHTEASGSLKKLVEDRDKSGKAGRNPRGVVRLSLTDAEAMDALSKLKSGQMKNVACESAATSK